MKRRSSRTRAKINAAKKKALLGRAKRALSKRPDSKLHEADFSPNTLKENKVLDEQVRSLYNLARSRHSNSVKTLEEAAKNEELHPQVRCEAIFALAVAGGKEAEKAILNLNTANMKAPFGEYVWAATEAIEDLKKSKRT